MPNVLTISIIREIGFFLPALSEAAQRDEREECSHNQNEIDVCVAHESEIAEIEGEQSRDKSPSHADVLNAEEDPNDGDRDESQNDGWHLADFLHYLTQEKFVGTDEQAMQGTPNDEIPRSTMPQTRQQEAEPKVEVSPALAFAIATQRDV